VDFIEIPFLFIYYHVIFLRDVTTTARLKILRLGLNSHALNRRERKNVFILTEGQSDNLKMF